MTRNSASRKSPVWLQPIWDRKRAETVRRVTVAIRALKRQRKTVTLVGIREAIRELDGVSISTNTIQRNELAYELYIKNATAGSVKKISKCGALTALQRTVPDVQRPALRAKIARLRRHSKDTLIAKIMEVEKALENQMNRENALREELLRVTLKTPQTGT